MSYILHDDALDGVQKWRSLYSIQARTRAKKRLARVLDEFEEFGAAYVGYFEAHVKPSLKKAELVWLDAQVAQALDTYWVPLARISEQYQVPHYKDIFFADSTEQAIECNLDKLREMVPGDLSKFDMSLYFDKTTIVHRYPYTNMAFIGMPYRLVTGEQPLNLQAIPHELGHYVYWNMGELFDQTGDRIPFTAQQQAFESQTREQLKNLIQGETAPAVLRELQQRGAGLDEALVNVLLSWLEETFADIVGARLGGNDYLNSTKKLITRGARTQEDLTRNDGRHPISCLRPFIVAHTLELKGPSPDNDWDDFKTQFGLNDVGDLKLDLPLSLEEETSSGSEEEMTTRLIALLKDQQNRARSVSVGVIKLALACLVDYINAQIDAHREGRATAFRVRGLHKEAKPAFAFDQLLKVAKKRKREADDVVGETYEFLLQPHILEGSYEYSHSHAAVSTYGHTLPTYHSAGTLGTHQH